MAIQKWLEFNKFQEARLLKTQRASELGQYLYTLNLDDGWKIFQQLLAKAEEQKRISPEELGVVLGYFHSSFNANVLNPAVNAYEGALEVWGNMVRPKSRYRFAPSDAL